MQPLQLQLRWREEPLERWGLIVGERRVGYVEHGTAYHFHSLLRPEMDGTYVIYSSTTLRGAQLLGEEHIRSWIRGLFK